MGRDEVLTALVELIDSRRLSHPTRVAIDGVDAAGKTTLRNELASRLEATGRNVIRASVDGFHNPAAVRYTRGRSSPAGYYLDSFNYEALRSELLNPLSPGGTRTYRTAVFDVRKDSAVDEPALHAAADAVLLFDGVFLLRPELLRCWDVSLFLHAGFDVTLARAEIRDASVFGGIEETRRRYHERYIPGQQLYLRNVRPRTLATVVLDNNDFMNPRLERGKEARDG